VRKLCALLLALAAGLAAADPQPAAPVAPAAAAAPAGAPVASAPAAAAAVDLVGWLRDIGAQMDWEPLREIGRITRSDREVVFKVGQSFLILDQNVRVEAPAPFRDGGAVRLPAETAAIARAHLEQPAEEGPRVAAVLLDPGHGGKDPGAIGRYAVDGKTFSIDEKDVVLEVGRRLRDMLARRYPDKRIELTRSDDTYLSLEERTRRANEVPVGEGEAIIFVSLHVNAALVPTPKGFEVWYLPPDFKRDLSDRTGVESREIVPILSSMLEAEYLTESVILARDISRGLEEQVGDVSENRGLKAESWFVVRNSKMPAVLIELGFITHPQEGPRLRDPEYLLRLATGIYNGIERFIVRFESSKGFTKTP
jgi:N-acetylmuramoyl-L-alanine amidase